ncbi:hypothetical protein ACHAWF_004667 [Thalassiosira exigua]
MAEDIRNKFVSWTRNVVKEIKEIPVPVVPPSPRNGACGVGIKMALVEPPPDSPKVNGRRYNRVGVAYVEPDGPAGEAGLREGDVVAEVDGRKFDDGRAYLPDDVAQVIRGPRGTQVVVAVEREGERVEFRLTRAPIATAAAAGAPAIPDMKEKRMPQRPKHQLQQRQQQQQTQEQSQQPIKLPEPKCLGEIQKKKEEQKKEYIKRVLSASDESAAGAIANSLESLAPSEERKKDSDDLASSGESADKFDEAAAPPPAPGSRPRTPSFSHRSASLDELSSEEKTGDGEAASSVHGEADDSSQAWEVVSERSGCSAVVVSFSGSILSGGTGASFRPPSPSALRNKFVLTEATGAPYLEHVVLPTDTLQGLCLAYKISATRLRMENGFSGNSLQMAPKKLKIPSGSGGSKGGASATVRTQDTTSREFKLYAFVAEVPATELVEAKAYLDLSNWDLDEALRSAREDEGWSPQGGYDAGHGGGGGGGGAAWGAAVRPKEITARDVFAAPPVLEGNGLELKDIGRG